MNDDERIDGSVYRVVVNDRRQFSLWPHDAELPKGWFDEGVAGSKDCCLAHIEQVWKELLAPLQPVDATVDHDEPFSATTSFSG
jgi:MbtH protein